MDKGLRLQGLRRHLFPGVALSQCPLKVCVPGPGFRHPDPGPECSALRASLCPRSYLTDSSGDRRKTLPTHNSMSSQPGGGPSATEGRNETWVTNSLSGFTLVAASVVAFGTFGEGSSVPQSFSSHLPQDLESFVIHLFIHLYSSSPHRLRGQLL